MGSTKRHIKKLASQTHSPTNQGGVQTYMEQKQIIFRKTPHLFTAVHRSTPQVQHNISDRRSVLVLPTPRPSTEVVNPQELDKIPPRKPFCHGEKSTTTDCSGFRYRGHNLDHCCGTLPRLPRDLHRRPPLPGLVGPNVCSVNGQHIVVIVVDLTPSPTT